MLQPTHMHCVTCDVSLRHSKTKLCPEPKVIKKYLHDNAGYDGDINEHERFAMHAIEHTLSFLNRRIN